MRSEMKGCERFCHTPETETERSVFLNASTTHELAKLELRAPGGGFLKDTTDTAAPFEAADLIQMRFRTPGELRALAELCTSVAVSMEALARVRVDLATMDLGGGSLHRS